MNIMRVVPAVLFLFVWGWILPSGTFAGTYNTIENSSPQEIVNGMSTKAARGIVNTTTGWLEIPKQIHSTYTEEGPTKGILLGPFKGIGMAVVRTVSGVAEFVTFFSSYPGFYQPYFDPAYVWEKE